MLLSACVLNVFLMETQLQSARKFAVKSCWAEGDGTRVVTARLKCEGWGNGLRHSWAAAQLLCDLLQTLPTHRLYDCKSDRKQRVEGKFLTLKVSDNLLLWRKVMCCLLAVHLGCITATNHLIKWPNLNSRGVRWLSQNGEQPAVSRFKILFVNWSESTDCRSL